MPTVFNLVPKSLKKMFSSKSRHHHNENSENLNILSIQKESTKEKYHHHHPHFNNHVTKIKVPLGDCTAQHLNIKVGDIMENKNVNFVTGGEISTQFNTIDEVQNMIRHLQQLEEHMITNGAKGFSASFEDLSLIDVDDFQIDENETEWLTKIPGAKKISAKDLQSDESFIDSGLLNVRYALLNLIKSSKIEEKATLLHTTSPLRCSKAMSSMGTYDIRRKSPPSISTNILAPSQHRPTSPMSSYNNKMNFENSPNRTYPTIRTENESSPPITTSIKSPYEFLSPGYQPQLSVFEKPNRDLFNSTPSGKIDSRTYTRPKKQRMPLDTTTLDQLDFQHVSPIKLLQNHHYQPQNNQPDIMEYDPPVESETLIGSNPKINMNETFVAAEFDEDDDDDNDECDVKRTSDKQSRRVTRNLSYVIRRDSESPTNNNSPPVPSSNNDGLENVEQLNSTFVRPLRRDTYSPSPTGSSNSIHNTSSMEELHNLARQQEQSLRMTNPRMLTRKETHTVVRVPIIDSHMQQPIIRNTTTEVGGGQQPQQKLRLQSRIPAPGTRIRPPTAINGHNNITTTTTRRPMTRGGAY